MTSNERFFKNVMVAALIAIVSVLLFINNEPETERHVHVEVNRYYTNGMRVIPVIMCRTDRSQVIFGTEHKVTELSIEYFSNKGD